MIARILTLINMVAFLMVVFPTFGMSQDLLNARDFGAVGDGKHDDTQAFLDAVKKGKADGKHVYVPRGTYLISKTVELENIGITGPMVGAWPSDVDALPSIIAQHRDGPAFHLLAGASLRGLDINYQGIDAEKGGPAAVLLSGVGIYISNLRIRYAWDGIIADGINNVGRLNIENVFMVSILNVGVRVTGTWDVPRLSNIEIWNAGPTPRGLNKGVGFHLLKNDLIRVTDCFVFAMSRGFLLEDRMKGSSIEGGTWGVMNGCSTDFCVVAIEVNGAHTLSVNGGTFWDHAESLLVKGKGARVRVTGSELKSNGSPAVRILDCDHTVISGCSIMRPMEGFDAPAVVLSGGATTLSANHIISCATGAVIGHDVRSALLEGNTIESAKAAVVIEEGSPERQTLVKDNLETVWKKPEAK